MVVGETSFEEAVVALRSIGEPTRLRILALLALSEATVKDLTEILAQSQPRVSRHLKLLTEARLADHFAKLGVRITQIGGPLEHRGVRVPSMMDVNEVIAGLRFFVKPIWRVVVAEIDAGYAMGRPASLPPR